MSRLTVLLFGIRAGRPGAFRLYNEPIEAGTVGEVFRHLSAKLGIDFVPEPCPDSAGAEPAWFQVHEQGERRGLAGVFVDRNGARCCAKQDLSFVLGEGDSIVVSTVG